MVTSIFSDTKAIKTGIWFWLVVATAVATAFLFFYAPNEGIGSDAKYTLVVSRAILHEGSIRLDDQLPHSVKDNYRITETNGHLYYTFPYGASLIVSPFVGLAELWGYDVRHFPDEKSVQKWLLAGTGALLILLCNAVLATYLSPQRSWTLTVVLVWGSVLATTFGSALWNLNISVLLILSAVWLLAQHHSGRATTTRPVLLGFTLFLAFICRPTTAVFILVAFLYLLLWSREEFWLAAGVAFLGLIIFAFYNHIVMGVWLPPYYLPQRLESRTPFLWALAGLLVSPSRGLLVFSPFIVYIIGLAVVGFKKAGQQSQRLLGLLLLWFAFHLLVIARFDHWWGGFSYGPRLLTDLMPAVIWLTAVAWPLHPLTHNRSHFLLSRSLFACLAIFSIYFNLYTGLYNPAAYAWNGGTLPPNIDRAPQYLFDWRYPQFLATETRNCRRNSDYFAQLNAHDAYYLSKYPSSHTVMAADARVTTNFDLRPPWFQARRAEVSPPDSASLSHRFYLPLIAMNSPIYFLAEGWHNFAEGRLESACVPATFIIGKIGPTNAEYASRSWRGHLTLGARSSQAVDVFINDRLVASLDLAEERESYPVTIPANTFFATGQNKIKIIPADGNRLARADVRAWDAPPIFFYRLRLAAVP